MNYSAKEDYQTEASARSYESRPMYNGIVGSLRKRIETRVIENVVLSLPNDILVLDCPCGNGRWFNTIGKRARSIEAIDVSEGMVNFARERDLNIDVNVSLGDAENLNLPDNSVDYVFSYALMKHIPHQIQLRILKEFARVSLKGVICSFAVLNQISYQYWKLTKQENSFPLFQEQLESMAANSGLRIVKKQKISQPIIGLEYLIQMEFV